MNTPLLRAEGLVRHYRQGGGLFRRRATVKAVDGLSLEIARGETLGLVGESGCGKSTTGRLLLGLEPSDAGTVRFDGSNLPPANSAAWRRSRARMQMVFQDPYGALDRRLSIGSQVAEPLVIQGIGAAAERTDRVRAQLAAVGLSPELAARYPHELSGGQRQRAVLARALVTGPDLLACDEPVSALDVSVQAQVINLLTDLQAERGMAMLFISHDLRVVRQVSHRVAVMYLGTIIEEGPPDALLSDPLHPYSKALVSAIPQPRRRRRERILLQGEPPNPSERPRGCVFHPRCPVALPACAEVAPTLASSGGGRRVACHRVETDASDGLVRSAA